MLANEGAKNDLIAPNEKQHDPLDHVDNLPQ